TEMSRMILVQLQEPENATEELLPFNAGENLSQLTDSLTLLNSHLSDEGTRALRQGLSNIATNISETVFSSTTALAGDVIQFIIGIFIMLVALYFFLADGEDMVAEAHRLTPFPEVNESGLFHRFDE